MIDLIKGDTEAPNFAEIKLDSFLIQLLNLHTYTHTKKKKHQKRRNKKKIKKTTIAWLSDFPIENIDSNKNKGKDETYF